MDYRYTAIDKLKRHSDLVIAEMNCKERLIELEHEKTIIKSANTETTPVISSQENHQENKMINIIAAEQSEKELLQRTCTELRQIERGLSVLSDEEKLVLSKFYVNREKDHVYRLMELLGYEKSEVYRIKDRALDRFTRALYGIIHI